MTQATICERRRSVARFNHNARFRPLQRGSSISIAALLHRGSSISTTTPVISPLHRRSSAFIAAIRKGFKIVNEYASFRGKNMDKNQSEVKDRTVHGHFGRFATVACVWLGSTWAFVGACLVVVVWGATGPVLHFSQAWAQVINTGTGIATFLMVFLIQNTQNRDARAINLKLNELIRAMDKARNQMIDIERLSDLELDEMQTTYEKIKTNWTERQKRIPGGPAER